MSLDMSPETSRDGATWTIQQKLGMAAASISFLIGWFQTGVGLKYLHVLNSNYGSFVLATGLLFLMLLSYSKAIDGSGGGLVFYLVCALVTFACNLNAFYPNYRGPELVRSEFRKLTAQIDALSRDADDASGVAGLNETIQKVASEKIQLQAQIRQKGLGDRARSALESIEGLLGLDGKAITITRLTVPGKTQDDWNNTAAEYGPIVDAALDAWKAKNQYEDKANLGRDARQLQLDANAQFAALMAGGQEPKELPFSAIEDLAARYRELCGQALKWRNPGGPARTFSCLPDYTASTVGLGTFSHTFTSAWATLKDGGTISVAAICFLIDFVVPLALYVLVRRQKNGSKRNGMWDLGGKRMPTSAN